MLLKTSYATGKTPTPISSGQEIVVCRAEFALTGDLALNDIIQMMDLPADHVPVDIIVDTDDLGTTGTVTVGLLNAGKTDIDTAASGGAAWLTSGDVEILAGGLRSDSVGLRTMARCASADVNRAIGIKIATDTTANSGTIGLTLLYRSS